MNTLPYLRNFELGGQVALVTGSARGLGFCIARALAGCGARVLINGRNAAAAQAAADTLKRDGLDAHALAFDVSDDAALQAAFGRIDAEHGRLDILVNNVGARNRKTLAAATPAEIRDLIDTDLVAGMLLAKFAAERMVRQGAGRLIAITSVVGELARSGDAVYPAAMASPATPLPRAPSPRKPTRPWSRTRSSGRASPRATRWAAGANRKRSPARPCSWPRARPRT